MYSRFGLRRIMLVALAALLLLPLISGLGLSQPASAASSLNLSVEQQAQSITYYNVLRVCVANHMYGDINTKASNNQDATPTNISWFNTDTKFVVYGSPDGETCNNVMADALKLWGFKADGSDFLTKMGYTFQATGSNAPRYHGSPDGSTRLTKYQNLVQSVAFSRSFTGDARLTGAPEYYAYKSAFSACKATSLGLYINLNSTQQNRVDTKYTDGNTAYTKISLANSDGTTLLYGYTYDNGGETPFIYGAPSEYIRSDNGGKLQTTCANLMSTVSSTAQAAATAAAAETCKQSFSSTSEINACAAGASNSDNIMYCSSQYKDSVTKYGTYNGKNDRTACYAGQGNNGGEQCYELGFTSADTLQACVNGVKHADDNTYCTTTYPEKSYSSETGDVIDQSAELNACKKGALVQPGKTVTFQGSDCSINPAASGCGSSSTANSTSCVVDGVGWIVCSMSRFLATMMDGIYGLLTIFMKVPALNVDTSSDTNTLYNVWKIMRNIANIAFVIAFLIIIGSQLTSFGVSNYGIKKMLPRLIVSAILVNISYWIAAIAVDLSNIIGSSLYNTLVGISNSLGDISVGVNYWEVALNSLLAGGGIAVAGGAVVAIAAASTGAAVASAVLWIAIPALLGAVLAVILAVAVLAARQALIIILIAASPLAFVAFLLPNTQKFFEMWRKSLTTMLIFYPIFSLIFAGSQIAALILLGSAAGANKDGGVTSTPTEAIIILALFVQVAPLFLTPMLIKFSGGIIGQMAGRLNNRNRGLIDRARKVRARKTSLAMNETLGHPRNARNPLSRIYRHVQNDSRRDADRKKAIDSENTAIYAGTSRPQELYDRIHNSGEENKIADANSEAARLSTAAATDLAVGLKNAEQEVQTLTGEHTAEFEAQKDVNLTYRTKLASQQVDNHKLMDDVHWNEALGDGTLAPGMDPAIANEARATQRATNISNDRIASAKRVQQQEYAQLLQNNARVAIRAGGIDPHGASNVVAGAIESQRKTYESTVAAHGIMQADQGLGDSALLTIAHDNSLPIEQREAAGRGIVKNGNIDAITPYMDYLATALDTAQKSGNTQEVSNIKNLQKAFGETIPSSPGKPMGLSAADVAAFRTGDYLPPTGMGVIKPIVTATGSVVAPTVTELQTLNTIETKGVSMDKWAIMDKADIARIKTLADNRLISAQRATELKDSIEKTLKDVRWSGRMQEREKDLLKELRKSL